MEKLDKVIRALECCLDSFDACPDCYLNDCDGCRDQLCFDALAWLKEQNRLIKELSDHIPCCDNCEGKTTLGERTDECVYEIEGFDSILYCAKRGIANCFGYRKKIEELEAKLEESEPVVHAHWEPTDILGMCQCSKCGFPDIHHEFRKRCSSCGAHMDEGLELRTGYCPLCDKHIEVLSNDSMGNCPDCGHDVVLHIEGETDV